MTRSNRSKTMQNFNRAADRTLTKVGNVTSAGVHKIAKWTVTDHTGTVERSSMMGLCQSANYSIARMALIADRMERRNNNFMKFKNTGQEISILGHVAGWIIDYLRYFLRLIWGFIEPIVFHILFTIFHIILILLLNAIFFYALFLLITS